MPDDKNNHINSEDDHSKIALLIERQREMLKRLDAFEKTQQEALKLVNRYAGGIAFLIAAGLLVGWWITIKAGLPWFH